MTPNIGIMQITSQFGPFEETKTTFRTQHVFLINSNQWGLHLDSIYRHPGGGSGGSNTKILPKITSNIGIMHTTSQFGPFDDTK